MAAGVRDQLHIVVAGLIGVGKTTFSRSLGEILGLPVFYEPVDSNPYLEDFYKNMSSCAFALQVFLMNKRATQQQQIVWNGQGGIQDRSIYEDTIFAKILTESGHMTERDYKTYIELLEITLRGLKRPNFIIYLDVSPEKSLERIKARGREFEKEITLEYLATLKVAYDTFLREISLTIPVIRVPWNDFPNNEIVAAKVVQEYFRSSNIKDLELKSDF